MISLWCGQSRQQLPVFLGRFKVNVFKDYLVWQKAFHFEIPALWSQRERSRGSATGTVAIAANASAAMDLSAFLSTWRFSRLRNLLHNQPLVQHTGLAHSLETDCFFPCKMVLNQANQAWLWTPWSDPGSSCKSMSKYATSLVHFQRASLK